jgi:hypothetical protein
MNDREKRLSAAVDALIALRESMAEYVGDGYAEPVGPPPVDEWAMLAGSALTHIESVAMPRKSPIRQLIGRWKEAA